MKLLHSGWEDREGSYMTIDVAVIMNGKICVSNDHSIVQLTVTPT